MTISSTLKEEQKMEFYRTKLNDTILSNIEQNEFINNTATEIGGDIYILDANVRIKGNRFRNNQAKEGGAIYIKENHLMKHIQLIEDNQFINNSADIGGSIFSENLVEHNEHNEHNEHESMNTHMFRNVFTENIAFNNSKNTFSYFSKLVLDMNNSMNDP